VPWYLLLNGTEPRWRLHDTVDSADLGQRLARVMGNGVIIYTLASPNEGELFQSLPINGKHLVTYVITEEADPDPAKTRSRYEATGF
jgi:hypothetical protein